MRHAIVAVATLVTVALTGCVLEPGHVEGRVSAGVSVEVDHDYTYFPSHQAYYCESCNEWWVIGGGGWVRTSVRPARIVITDDTPWVSLSVSGPQAQVRFTETAREYPSDWNNKGPKGPPPGRGWRK